MLRFLERWVRRPHRSCEFEADLRPTAACSFGGIGEAEIEHRARGLVTVELSLKHTALPDGSEVAFRVEGVEVVRLVVRDGYAEGRFEFQADPGQNVIQAGDSASFAVDGEVLYEGHFRVD